MTVTVEVLEDGLFRVSQQGDGAGEANLHVTLDARKLLADYRAARARVLALENEVAKLKPVK